MSTIEKEILDEIRARSKNDEPEKCRHGTYLWCEACVQANYAMGIGVGHDAATTVVLELLAQIAGEKFMRSRDDEARAIRDIRTAVEKKLQESCRKEKQDA